MKRHLRWSGPALLVGVLVVLAVAYGAWTALSLRHHLAAADDEAHTLRAAIADRDQVAAQAAYHAMADNLSSARARADSPAWRVATWLPGFGDDARAIRTVAQVGDELATGSVKNLVGNGGWRLVDRLTPHHGRVDVDAVRQLAPTVAATYDDVDRARTQLVGIDAADLSGWVRPSFDKVRGQVDSLAAVLGPAARAFRVLPAMLGADGPRRWLLVFGNNAEIRATGGLPGAVALVRTDHGRISMAKQASTTDFSSRRRPILTPTRAERVIYHNQPGLFFQDANFIPEFPRSAALWRAWWQQRFGQRVDGVASIDTVTLSYLLRATGPVTVDGVRLTPDNTTDELLHRVYERLPHNAQQDAFFRDVAKTMFGAVTDGAGSPAALVGAAGQGVEEGRIYVHSFHRSVQQVVQPTPIAGALDFGPSNRPQLGIWLNDGTGSKMSYYLRTRVRATSQTCTPDGRTLTMSMRFTSTAPKDASKLPAYITGGGVFGTARGHQLVVAHLYGPSGGRLSGFAFDGRRVPVPSVEDRGRPVATTVIDLAAGQQTTMTWRVTTGPGQRAAMVLRQGPGMESRPARTTIRPSCG